MRGRFRVGGVSWTAMHDGNLPRPGFGGRRPSRRGFRAAPKRAISPDSPGAAGKVRRRPEPVEARVREGVEERASRTVAGITQLSARGPEADRTWSGRLEGPRPRQSGAKPSEGAIA